MPYCAIKRNESGDLNELGDKEGSWFCKTWAKVIGECLIGSFSITYLKILSLN